MRKQGCCYKKTSANHWDGSPGRMRAGSVLVLTVWTLLFLSSLAVATRSCVVGHLRLAANLRDRQESYFLAKAGVETALILAAQDTNRWDALTEPWATAESAFRDVRVGTGRFDVLCHPADEAPGARYGLLDEESKINLNKPANMKVITLLLQQTTGRDSLTATRIAASITDWRDDDSDAQENGAESDYYQSLPVPYAPHNELFDDVSELRLVRGMTDEVYKKICPHLTVYGSGRVNMNTAGATVLAAMLESVCPDDLGLVENLGDKILAFRRDKGVFKSSRRKADLVAALSRHSGLSQDEENALNRLANSGLIDVYSTHLRGETVGRTKRDAARQSRIEFVFNRRNGKIRYWHEE